MKKLKYVGEIEVILPHIGLTVLPGDEIEVDEDFNNALFVPVEEEKIETKKKGDSK